MRQREPIEAAYLTYRNGELDADTKAKYLREEAMGYTDPQMTYLALLSEEHQSMVYAWSKADQSTQEYMQGYTDRLAELMK